MPLSGVNRVGRQGNRITFYPVVGVVFGKGNAWLFFGQFHHQFDRVHARMLGELEKEILGRIFLQQHQPIFAHKCSQIFGRNGSFETDGDPVGNQEFISGIRQIISVMGGRRFPAFGHIGL